jgi:hypothetical protein
MSKKQNHPYGGPSKECLESNHTGRRRAPYASGVGHGFLASEIYPLSLWRTLRAQQFEPSDLAAIRDVLANTSCSVNLNGAALSRGTCRAPSA